MLFLVSAYDNTFSIWNLHISSLFQPTSAYGVFASRSASHNNGSNLLCFSLLALHSSLASLKRKEKKSLSRERSIWVVHLFSFFFWRYQTAIETDFAFN